MKQYFFKITLFALLLVAVGCQKEEGIGAVSAEKMAEIDLSLDGMKISTTSDNMTRGKVTDLPNFDANGFTMVGYYTVGTEVDGKKVSGRFDENKATATPNVFNKGITDGSPIVSVTKNKNGKFYVKLSNWELSSESYLSYFAWATNTPSGGTNPITKTTSASTELGAPFLEVTNEKDIAIVVSKSIDNHNVLVQSRIELDFKHILSKLKFNVRNTSPVAITLTEANIRYTGVYNKAKFLFNGVDSPIPGNWNFTDKTPVTSTRTVTLSATAIDPDKSYALDELLIIPQTLITGAVAVELTYTLNGNSYKRAVPLKAQSLMLNNSYTYDLLVNESQVAVNQGQIGEWVFVKSELPCIAGPCDPNVPLILDAFDAPYTHTDLKQYWLDRSGFNNHCELTDVTYDGAKKCYVFNGKTSVGKLPAYAFGANPKIMNIDLIARRTDNNTTVIQTGQSIFTFTKKGSDKKEKRIMFMHFGYHNELKTFFDAAQPDTVNEHDYDRISNAWPWDWYTNYGVYSFYKNYAVQGMVRNVDYNYKKISFPNTSVVVGTPDNLIGPTFSGELKFFRVNLTATPIDKTGLAVLQKRYKIPEQEYVQNGLLLDLRGTDALVGEKWKNRAGTGATFDATKKGKTELITYNATDKYYQTGSEGNKNSNGGPCHFEVIPSGDLLDLENHTIEMVFKSHPDTHDCLMIQTENDNTRGIFYCSYYSDGMIRYQAPTSAKSGSNIQLSGPTNGTGTPPYQNPIGTTLIRSNVIQREKKENNTVDMSVFLDGNADTLLTKRFNFTAVGKSKLIKIGQGGIQISAIRIYNRVLTTEERMQNFYVDRAKYDIPDRPIIIK